MKKLAIILTHPIQYFSPLFKLLTERGVIQIKVFYTWPQAVKGFKDKDFGKQIEWDIPLLDGYNYALVKNTSKNPSSKTWRGINTPSLINEVNAYNPDAIMVFGWKLKSHFQLMRYFKGRIPIWFRGDSNLLDEQPGIKTKLRRLILKIVYKYIDKAFYVGQNNFNYYLAHGLKKNQLKFAPHAIDNERFFHDEHSKEETEKWRSKLGFTNKDRVILFCGKLEPKKNPLFLVNAIINHNKTNEQKVGLVVVGNGILEAEVTKLASQDNNIKILPFQNQSLMPVIYRLGNIFCLPSQGPEETWGLSVNEALASGVAVLVSNKVGCAVDLVSDNVGRIFKSNDYADFETKLNELLKQGISATVCKKSISKWNYSAICKSIESELNQT
jgi:glycosyltransferase involved in cell wall biosynthesis